MALSRGFTNRWGKALAYARGQVRLLTVNDHDLIHVNNMRDFDTHVMGAVESGGRGWYSLCLYIRDGKVVYGQCSCKDHTDGTHAMRAHPFAGKFGIPEKALVGWCKHTIALSLVYYMQRMGIDWKSFPTVAAAWATREKH